MRNLNLVHLNGLKAVEAVGRLGSLQAAADELGVTIGAVSQQVIKSERQLGRTLFLREPRGMVLTGVGAALLPRLSAAFGAISQALDTLRDDREQVLTISVAPVFAARWLVFRIGEFAERHPDIRLRLDATTKIADPSIGDVDLCIRVGRGNWPGVEAELLLPQLVFPVCAPALAERLKEPRDLIGMPAVLDGRSMFSWDVWLSEVGLGGQEMSTGHVFNEASLSLDATIAGQGVMLAWQTLASHAIRAGQLVVPFARPVPTGAGHYLVTASGTRKSPKLEAFRSWITEALQADMAALEPLINSA
ncbi:LysR substrate-binding domain-containing protein [Rhizobium halophytocola]|uniref:DNA-binding transcriptional LysR family regulator n=1 Tax=Rhizobium halophytocola TaxID=735519 RepID=A0ABS4E022_9HYPH|nr:LysR substrate-binding domain-containing protein [Rhizobium halophytocola]MBP1851288.1 DNA-binding transcriptional LysR family regulator [Rhizobium halophytocola]